MKLITLVLFTIIAVAYVSGQDVNSAEPSGEPTADSDSSNPTNSENQAPSDDTSETTSTTSTTTTASSESGNQSSETGEQPCRCPHPRSHGPPHGFGRWGAVRFERSQSGGPRFGNGRNAPPPPPQ